MKTALLTLALAAASLAAAAQSQPAAAAAPAASAAPADAYTAMLAATIAEQNAAGPAALPANVAKLERAASARPADWLPRYYQARAYLKMGFSAQGDDLKDQNFDYAQAALDQAKKLAGLNQAEVLVLQAYIYQGRIMVSPMTRGMVYAGRVSEALEMARKLDPTNPRVYLVLANDLYYRPAMFGGGPDKAKPLYEKAAALFATFKPAGPLSPNWGEGNATARLTEINAELASSAAATK
ncbi:hypothetical protein [Hymenobacter convexus]|uniref:hypothetical protein n=1 Tax=Hymenobacter sp. CA1UV-4 TaxID=3063782 RepID=UPI002712A9D9|nr:hypothetical protein [Hymenobacter sp. CA1UV-4]MDO7853804.1 hypothetical protein [Hymenobacter sp. CA1UV-4]